MSDIITPPPPSPPRLLARSVRWGAELCTVFVGVYAAFMLNGYQTHRQERQRREQVLAWMEADYTASLEDVKRGQASIKKQSDLYFRRIAAGEMPPIHALDFDSDYDPSDTASLLSSGGFDLLEVETVREIKETEGTLRSMVNLTRHDQQLSDTLILPNLDKDSGFFYDPATHRLRSTFQWYADFAPAMTQNYHELRTQVEKVLVQIRAERQRNR